uniref:Uncharacterized protein n=1 Tax=Rhizophora mucronata TaxID=61149 RepID=A0A2P2JTB3_RHIMU
MTNRMSGTRKSIYISILRYLEAHAR